MKMNYGVIGTNQLGAATQFYNSLFEHTVFKQVLSNERMTFWQGDDPNAAFAVAIPYDQAEASHGNGSMLGFSVETEAEVSRLYQKAIDLGGCCEGKPGQRGPRFSAYVRDLDHNKLVFSV